jgi:hypothetical protein
MNWEETGLLDDLTDKQIEIAINRLNYFYTIFSFTEYNDPAKKIATEHYRNLLYTLTSVLCHQNIYFEEEALLKLTAAKIKSNPTSIINAEKFVTDIISEITFEVSNNKL